jgi:hypothetical protein
LIPTFNFPVKPSVAAAVLLVALELVHSCGQSLPGSLTEVLELTGAGKSQAYEMRSRVQELLANVHQPAGRPATEQPNRDQALAVTTAVRDFVMRHPGVVLVRNVQCTYKDSFRRFVVGLFAPAGVAEGLTVEQAAQAVGVPLGTLKDWLRPPTDSPSSELLESQCKPLQIDTQLNLTQPQLATLFSEFESWQGDLSGFCDYARNELHLPFGRTFITNTLTAAGLYLPSVRRSPHQPPWSRGSLHAPFPGMQWFGDGKQLFLVYRGQKLTFNIEAFVDSASNAAVAARVTRTEDAQAVVEAFQEGLQTTQGQPPLAVTLDNRPSNFAPQVDAALSCTELLRATPGRGQAKAPVEGSFGLFEQSLPQAIVIQGDTVPDIAQSIAQWVVYAFFCGRNGKPRGKLGGLSPAQAYNNTPPTEDQIQAAKSWILELRRREQLARQTRERHADPVRLAFLREQLAILGIEDPQGQASLCLCCYSMAAIVYGLAAFRTKLEMDTLPKDCDHFRYLGGIIRNCDTRDLLERTAKHLLDIRVRAQDISLAPLETSAKAIRQSTEAPEAIVSKLVDRALDAPSVLEFRFWTGQANNALGAMPRSKAVPLYQHLARVIAGCLHTDRRRREQLLATLAEAAVPLAV